MSSELQARPAFPDVLIAPLDGSRTSERSIPLLVRLADHLDVPVRFLHVFDSIRQLRKFARTDIEWSEDADPRALLDPPAWMEDSVSELAATEARIEVVGRVGKPSEEIIKELNRTEHSWAIMSSLGATGTRKLFLGSTTRKVVRSATSPLIVVPAHLPKLQAESESRSGTVSVLLDGTEVSHSSIPHAAAIAEGCGLNLEFVRVAETFRDDAGAAADELRWEKQSRDEVEGYLDRIAEEWSSLSCPVSTAGLGGNPVKQICRHVEESSPLLVALATRRRSGIERWTYGSVAEKLADSVSIPLMLVPVDDAWLE